MSGMKSNDPEEVKEVNDMVKDSHLGNIKDSTLEEE